MWVLRQQHRRLWRLHSVVRVQTLVLARKLLSHVLHVCLPLVQFVGRLGIGECLAEFLGDLENAQRRFLCLLQLLLDGVVLWLEREHTGVALRQEIQTTLRLLRGNGDELGCHQITDGADILLVFDASQNSIVQFGNVRAGEGCVERRVESFVGTLGSTS